MPAKESKAGNRLPARFTRKGEFDRVFRNGKRFRKSFLQIVICHAGSRNKGRIGFVITAKLVRKATKRNRIRRILKEAVRHWWKYIQPGTDIVFRVLEYPEFNHAWYAETVFLQLLIESGRLIDEGKLKARERINCMPAEYGGVMDSG